MSTMTSHGVMVASLDVAVAGVPGIGLGSPVVLVKVRDAAQIAMLPHLVARPRRAAGHAVDDHVGVVGLDRELTALAGSFHETLPKGSPAHPRNRRWARGRRVLLSLRFVVAGVGEESRAQRLSLFCVRVTVGDRVEELLEPLALGVRDGH